MAQTYRLIALAGLVLVCGAAMAPTILAAGAAPSARPDRSDRVDVAQTSTFQGIIARPHLASLRPGAIGTHHIAVVPLYSRLAPSRSTFTAMSSAVASFYSKALPGTKLVFDYSAPHRVRPDVACAPIRAMSYAQARSGVDLSRPFEHVLAWAPSCPASGYAWHSTGNGLMWLGGTNAQLLAHEFGHNLGLLHSNALNCVDAINMTTALSSHCAQTMYADPFSVMGTRCDLTTSCRLVGPDLASLTGRAIEVKPGGTRTVSLTITGAAGAQTAFMNTGLGTVYFDPGAAGAVPNMGPVEPGVQVRVLTRAGNALLRVPDVAAGADGLAAPELRPLDSWLIPGTSTRLVVLSATNTSATLQFLPDLAHVPELPTPTITSAPRTLFNEPYLLRWTSSGDQRSVLGYVVARTESGVTVSRRVSAGLTSVSLPGVTTRAGAVMTVWAIDKTGRPSAPSQLVVRTNPDFIRFTMNGQRLRSIGDDPRIPVINAVTRTPGVLRWSVDADQATRITGWRINIALHDGTWVRLSLPASARHLRLSPHVLASVRETAIFDAPYVVAYVIPSGVNFDAEIALRPAP